MDAADEVAGRGGPCPHCGKTAGVRLARSEATTGSSQFWSNFFKPSWLGCFIPAIILIDIIGVLLAQLLPAVQAAREAARQVQCVANLKQIGVAMQRYHQQYGCFPPAFIADANGTPKHSWRVLILPFLGEQALYDQYRFEEPWNSSYNMALAVQMPKVYRCPSDDPTGRSQTSYAMIVGPHAVSDGPSSHRIADIKDSGTGTIMVAEASNAAIQWLEPRDLKVKDMTFVVNTSQENPGGHKSDIAGPHSNVVNVLFCDGRVDSIDRGTGEKTLKAMMTAD
jgi:prepilin-type processing-associated H-X9-DG protein